MKHIAVLILLVGMSGCSIQIPDPAIVFGPQEIPQANIPLGCRQSNWTKGHFLNGSCVHASLMSLFRWQCQPNLADWWKENHGGGETPWSLVPQLDKAGITYAMTFGKADVEFLEWACRTRRGAGVAIYGRAHMVALVGLTDEWAILLDNNSVHEFIYVPRETFINEWLFSDSWAVTPLYSPCPPKTRV